MKTPYDAIVRIARRQSDMLKLSIGIEIGRIAETERDEDALEAEVVEEMEQSAQDWRFSAHAFLTERAQRSARLLRTREEHLAELAHLRARANDAYARMKMADDAATDFVRRETDRAERKAAADLNDILTARRLRDQKRAARNRSDDR